MSVAGFDIGNDGSCVALARKRGVDVLMNKESKRETPTAVAFGTKMRSFGGDASAGRSMNMRNTIVNIRRLLGKPFNSPDVQREVARLPFKVVEGPRGLCAVEVDFQGETQVFPMEKVAAMMMLELKKIAEADQGSAITDCVLSCPVYATETERAAMLDAARIAGLVPLRIVNENTATALGYGIYKTDLPQDDPVNVAIVDYGHTGIQVAIVALTRQGLRVLAHSWDTSCGGKDLDWALFEMVRAEFKSKTGLDLMENRRSTLRTLLAVEKCKKVLSANPKAPLSVECAMDDRDINMMVEREHFEQLCGAPFSAAESAMRRALEQSGLDTGAIAAVECVGGSSRVPAFMNSIRNVFQKEPSRTLHTKECVARGCALQCAMLSPIFRVRDFAVVDTLPFPVAIEYDSADADSAQAVTVKPVFNVGAPFPQSVRMTLYRNDAFEVRLRYADGAAVPEGTPSAITAYKVGPIPAPGGGEKAKIKLQIGVNIHGQAVIEDCVAEETREVVEKVPVEKKAEEGKEEAPKEGEGKAEEAGGDVAMGAEGEPKAEEPEMTEVTRKVVDKKPVPVAGVAAPGMPTAELEAAKQHEFDMSLADRRQEETNNAKNDLEGYILRMRSQLLDGLAPFVSEPASESFRQELTKAEDWLYDEGEDTTKGVYLDKLASLRKVGDPIEARAREHMERPGAISHLEATCARYLELASSAAPEHAHISEDDRGKVRAECEAALSWLKEKRGYQESLAKTDDPVLTVEEMRKKADTVERVCKPVMSQPAPAPKKEEKAEEKAKEEAKEGGEGGEAMETDDGADGANGGGEGEGAMETD